LLPLTTSERTVWAVAGTAHASRAKTTRIHPLVPGQSTIALSFARINSLP
jgi:hypothetical protein